MTRSESEKDIQAKSELTKINDLLRDYSFAVKVTELSALEDSASTNRHEDTHTERIIKKSFKEEKIAVNLAGFYAVVCGVNAVSVQTGKKPVIILKQIVEQHLHPAQINLLNRFANATWKASQPFRDWSRIKRDNFIVFAFLSEKEIKKDYGQIVAASALLLTKLNASENFSKEHQLQQIEKLLQDTTFAYEMAAYMEAAYYEEQNQSVPPFISAEEETAIITKTKKDETLANSVTGFYALACGVEYLSEIYAQLPSFIVQLVVDNSLQKDDKELLQRLADATYKIAQVCINLDNISSKEFIPFDLLPPEYHNKRWLQMQNAARLLQSELK